MWMLISVCALYLLITSQIHYYHHDAIISIITSSVIFIVKVKSLSRVQLFATPWTVAYQAPPSMGFSRQENWSGLPFPSPGDIPNPGNEAGSLALQADPSPTEL